MMNKERIITVAIILCLLATTVACNKTAEDYFNSGNTKYDQKDFKGAIQDYTNVIKLNPKNSDAYYIRGNTKYELKDYRGAIQDYNKAIELNPKDYEAYNNRGLAKISLGQKKDGCLDLSKAGELGHAQAYEAIKKNCN